MKVFQTNYCHLLFTFQRVASLKGKRKLAKRLQDVPDAVNPFCNPSSSFVWGEAQLGQGKERGGQAPRGGASFLLYLFVGHLHTITVVFFFL